MDPMKWRAPPRAGENAVLTPPFSQPKGTLMKLLNPAMTINNAAGPHWLVSFEHDFGDGEMVMLTVKVLKTDRPLSVIQKDAFDRATELLQVVSRRLD